MTNEKASTHVFGISETDSYVRNILSRAGNPPAEANSDQLVDWLLPHVEAQESGGDPNAVSAKGALGRLQVMPTTAAAPGFGIAPAKDHSPQELERVGKSYLKAMIERYPGRPDLALAAYNAGPGRADKWAANDPVKNQSRISVEPGLAHLELFRESAGVEGLVSVAPDLGELETTDRTRAEPTWRDYFTDVVGNDSSIAAFHNIAEDSGYRVDPGFSIEAIPAKDWAALTAGIPEDIQPRLGAAVSMDHLRVLAARARAEVSAEEEMAQFGGWGVAGRFALNMLDPLSLAVGAATGGIGAATKGYRLGEAAKAAIAAGELGDAKKVVDAMGLLARQGKWAGSGRAFAAAGVENAALETVLDQGNMTRDGWDIATAGLTGGLLGAGFSRVFRGREMDNIRIAYARAREELNLAELQHTISIRQTEIDRRMKWLHSDGEVATAKAELKQLEARHATERQAHEERLAAGQQSRQGYLDNLRASRRKELEPVLARAMNAETMRLQLDSRVGKARQAVEGLQERIEGGDTSSGTRANMVAASRHLKEVERLYDNHVKRTAGHAKAADAAKAALQAEKASPDAGDEFAKQIFSGRQAFERTGAEQRLSAAEGSVEARRSALQGEQASLADLRAAGVKASDKQVAEIFGPDTASSARFMGFNEGVHPHLDEDSGLPSANPVARMGAQGTRGKIVDLGIFRKGPAATLSMILRGSPDETVRNELGRLVANSIGTDDGSANTVGASEIAHILRQRYEAKFNQIATPAYAEWRQKNGIGAIQGMTRLAREDFMSDVGRAVRGDASKTDPSVLKMAAGIKKIFADYLQEAKAAGVKGFENVEARDGYLPRVFDFHSQHEIEGRIGSDNLRLLVQRAIQSSNDDMGDALAAKISKAYVKRMKELRVGADVGLMQGMKWDDVGFLRQFLNDAGLAPKEVEDVVSEMAALNARRERQTEGSFRNAKHRVQLDENFAMSFRDQVAAKAGRMEDIEVRTADLFENNVEALFGRYNRSVAGHVGLAKVGIKSKGDFEESITKVERALESDLDELGRVRDTAEAAYSLITGTPIEKSSTLTRLGRASRDWNFTTTMGQSGWAQFPDLAGLLQSGYIGHTIKHFPEVFQTIRRKDGKIDLEFYREQEAWLGLGTDLFNNRTFSSYDWGSEGEGLSGVLGKAEHGLRVAGRGVQRASGLSFMTEMSQRLTGRVIVQRLVKDVLEGGALSEDRALQLGLDGAMKARIAKQLKDHTVWVDGEFGGKVQIVNYVAWKDTDARDAMLYAVSRESRRLVQEEDLGDTALWMHKNYGKVLAQFRRFALVSYSRQLLHGIAHADAEEATRVMVSMAMAAMAYNARHHTAMALKEAGGATPEELEQYREKYLGVDRLAAAALANSSYSSILPGLWDTGQYYSTGTRFFDTRSSGLGSDIITGNPTYGLISNFDRAARGVLQSAIRGDRQFDQGDSAAIRRLLPFQNVLGMDLPFSALASGLPQKDIDAAPEHLDWLIEEQ